MRDQIKNEKKIICCLLTTDRSYIPSIIKELFNKYDKVKEVFKSKDKKISGSMMPILLGKDTIVLLCFIGSYGTNKNTLLLNIEKTLSLVEKYIRKYVPFKSMGRQVYINNIVPNVLDITYDEFYSIVLGIEDIEGLSFEILK